MAVTLVDLAGQLARQTSGSGPEVSVVMSDQSTARRGTGLWSRIPLVIRAIIIGVLVAEVGIVAWGALLLLAPPPIAIVTTLAFLILYWLFFSGQFLWRNTMEGRRDNFRETSLATPTWKWGLVAAGLFVVAIEASIFTLFRLIPYPAKQFAPPTMLESVPTAALWVALIVASLVAGVCEETGFRGYIQRPLESRYGPTLAIAITTVAFAAFHLNQPWAITLMVPILLASVMLGLLAFAARSLIPGIIGHTVMDVFNFSFWWWSLIGHYDQSTIFESGIDVDFMLWSGTLVMSLTLFGLVVRKLLNLPRPK
jgi:membrane protease YdiL (CAAX protease family)